MQKPKCHLMVKVCQYQLVKAQFSLLLSNHVGVIAQVLEILGHQSEVGVKASGFLIIYNKVLKSIDIDIFT